MKKLVSLLSSLLLFANCNDNDVLTNTVETPNQPECESSNLKYIQQYVGLNPATRSGETRINPYVYEGDTVLFIVNEPDGWKLLSNDTSVPMVLATSQNGQFDLEEENTPEVLIDYIDHLAQTLHHRKTDGVCNSSAIGDWLPYAYADSISSKDTIYYYDSPTRPDNPLTPIICDFDDVPGEGRWVVISKDTLSFSIPWHTDEGHLVRAHWHQSSPFNVYTPRDSQFRYLAGCVAVAIGQYLHYLSTEKNFSVAMPTTADFDPISKCFIFSGESTRIWSEMALTDEESFSRVDNVALILGYIGQQVNMSYTALGSGANFEDFTRYLATLNLYDTLNINTPINVHQRLTNGFPLLALASSRQGETGHMFIIDGGKETLAQIRITYGWAGVDASGHRTIIYDQTGNPFYMYQCSKTITVDQDYYKINWGWGINRNDDYYFTPLLDPETDGINARYTNLQIINTTL